MQLKLCSIDKSRRNLHKTTNIVRSKRNKQEQNFDKVKESHVTLVDLTSLTKIAACNDLDILGAIERSKISYFS